MAESISMASTDVSLDSKEPTTGEHDDLRREISERWKVCEAHYGEWEKVAKHDYDFGMGDQWKSEDRQTLTDEGRPVLTFNRVRPLINLVSGYQRENSARIKVNPEGGEDRIFSEVMDRALKQVDKWSHLDYKLGYFFDDGCYAGKGWLEAVLDYERDPIRAELDFKQLKFNQVRTDPECTEYDINAGARYAFKPVRLSRQQLRELYPDKVRLINGFKTDNDDPIENGSGILQEGSDDDYGNNPNKTTVVSRTDDRAQSGLVADQTFTVKEYWRVKLVPRFFVVEKESGEPTSFDTKDEAEAFVLKQGFGKPVERKMRQMWVAAQVSGHILQDVISPFEPFYNGFPFFRFIADWAPSASNEVLRVQGLVRPLKDPQYEKNKAKSQSLHVLNTQSNSGWIGDEDALTDADWERLESMGSKPGITIRKKRGSDLREIQPKGPNMGLIQREEKADDEFKQISGINADLMGFQEGTTSGRAISMRIKQAVLSLVRIFANYRYSKEIIGTFILRLVPMLFDAKKLMKVLGPAYMKQAIDPEKYPDGLTDGVVEAFLQMVKDHKYDVYVAESDQNKTIRYEIFQDLTELVKAGAPIPVDMIVDYMDLPNSEEVKKRIQAEQQRMAEAAAAGKK